MEKLFEERALLPLLRTEAFDPLRIRTILLPVTSAPACLTVSTCPYWSTPMQYQHVPLLVLVYPHAVPAYRSSDCYCACMRTYT
eukprot:3933314-Rhodomonas_salina.2